MPKAIRKPLRLINHDYARGGGYFITILTADRRCILGEVVDFAVRLTGIGSIVQECINRIAPLHPCVEMVSAVIMPNHVHLLMKYEPEDPRSLSTIIGRFKAASTKICRQKHYLRHEEALWHRSFHDRVIRHDSELVFYHQYIMDNPVKWDLDRLNPGWRAQ